MMSGTRLRSGLLAATLGALLLPVLAAGPAAADTPVTGAASPVCADRLRSWKGWRATWSHWSTRSGPRQAAPRSPSTRG